MPRLREAGRTRDGRKISHLNGGLLPPGGLYRIAWGNGRTETGDVFDDCCQWCGETPGRLYSYDDRLDVARARDVELTGDLFCSLHCWGQQSGYTDL